MCVGREKLEAAPELPFGAFRFDEESFGTPAAFLKPCGQRAEEGGREAPRDGGVLGVERAQERAVRVGSELELRGAKAQRLGEKRTPETADGVVGRREGRRNGRRGRLNARRGRGRRSRRLALEALDEVLENGVRRDVELHLEARRIGEILQQHEIARVRGRDPEALAGKRERKRAEAAPLFRGKALDDVRVRGDERRVRDARETVGLRKSGDQDFLGDGARGEKRPLDRPAVRLLPRRGAAQPAHRQVGGRSRKLSVRGPGSTRASAGRRARRCRDPPPRLSASRASFGRRRRPAA